MKKLFMKVSFIEGQASCNTPLKDFLVFYNMDNILKSCSRTQGNFCHYIIEPSRLYLPDKFQPGYKLFAHGNNLPLLQV